MIALAGEVPPAFTEDASAKLESLLSDEQKSLQKFLDTDPIEAKLSEVFKDKVTAPTKDTFAAFAQIDARFAAFIPPGFADVKKGDYRKYGDALMWMQMLDHAKTIKRPIVFITSEKNKTGGRKMEAS